MRILILTLLLTTTLILPVSSPEVKPLITLEIETGPGRLGECVPWVEVRDSGWEVSEGYYIVAGSLYEGPLLEDSCMRKVEDFPYDMYDIYSTGVFGESVRLWNGRTEYRFQPERGRFEECDDVGFLTPFLDHAVVEVVAAEKSIGCFGGLLGKVHYSVAANDGGRKMLRSTFEKGPILENATSRNSAHDVSLDDLIWHLRSLNSTPYRTHSLSDIEWDAADLKACVARVARDLTCLPWQLRDEDEVPPDFESAPVSPSCDQRGFYFMLPGILDRISPGIVRRALLGHTRAGYSTSGHLFTVTVVNDAAEELRFSFGTYGPKQPYNMPWEVEYNGHSFHTYNVELARLLMQLLPRAYEWNEREEKVDLLYVVAWYLGEMRTHNPKTDPISLAGAIPPPAPFTTTHK